jgi:hypothetical protein
MNQRLENSESAREALEYNIFMLLCEPKAPVDSHGNGNPFFTKLSGDSLCDSQTFAGMTDFLNKRRLFQQPANYFFSVNSVVETFARASGDFAFRPQLY